MKKAIIMFGTTASGKSYLGKKIEENLSIPYVSFGDLKRQEIHNRTNTGLNLQSRITNNLPIDPLDGLNTILNSHIVTGSSILSISGFPINIPEYNHFIKHFEIICGIHLEITHELMKERYFNRAYCPVCFLPGAINESCSKHRILMIQREDASELELSKRIKLYEQTILPFVNCIESFVLFPILNYTASKFHSDQVCNDLMNLISVKI